MADEIIAKYKADLKDYNSQIKKGTNQAEKDFDKVDESASGLSKTITKIGGAIAAAFAVERIASFTAEASKLAAEGEGVRKAFERIGNPQLLAGLREATRGTVSDLELMKNAVQASNFKIPLQELAKLFEFARRRAKETGESVEYLTNSIVTGLGRRSPLILDNLQLTTKELQKAMGGTALAAASIGELTAAAAKVAQDEIRKMGEETVTTKDRMDKLSASVSNLKEQYGDMVNKSALFYADLFGIIDLTEGSIDAATKAALNSARDLGKALDEGLTKPSQVSEKLVSNLAEMKDLQTEILRIRSEQEKVGLGGYVGGEEDLPKMLDRLKYLKEFNKAVNQLLDDYEDGPDEDPTIEIIKNVAYWRAEIKRLQKELGEENRTIDQNIKTVNALTHATEELNKILKPTVDEFERLRAAQGALSDVSIIDMAGGNVAPTLNSLKELLKIQQEIRDTSPEFSQAFIDATSEIERLTKAIKNFGVASDEAISKSMDAATKAVSVGEKHHAEFMAGVDKGREQRLQNIELYTGAAMDAAHLVSNVIVSQAQKTADYEQRILEDKFSRGLLTQEEYENGKANIRRKQAQATKDAATFDAIINTASAVMQALGSTPPPASYGLAAAAGILGGVQIGLIQSEPIPQFAKGTKDAPQGLKWVGEEGPELIYDQGGYPIITHRESMKIMEKYHIPSINYEAVERGGFEGLADSARLNGFTDTNILFATDRLRQSNKDGFVYMAKEISKALKTNSRNVW